MKTLTKIFLSLGALVTLIFFIYFALVTKEPEELGYDPLDISTPPQEMIENPPIIQPKPEKDLILAKEQNTQKIYWLQNGKKYPITSSEILKLMQGIKGWEENKIQNLSSQELSLYQLGPTIFEPTERSDGLLVRMEGAPYVFEIRKGGKRFYVPEREFKGRSLNPKDVILVSPRLIKLMPFGEGVKHYTLQEAAKEGLILIKSTGNFFRKIATFKPTQTFKEHIAINIEKGDVLVSKVGKQSLVITQDFEVFIPRETTPSLEGLMGACIDRYKQWPQEEEVLDVTLNLKDWPLKLAQKLKDLIEIIDLNNLHQAQYAQEAIWKITDNIKIKEASKKLLSLAKIDPNLNYSFVHLSNPNPVPDQTNFVVPPEISIPGIIARLKKECPPTQNADLIICKEEAKLALTYYLLQKEVPHTQGQKIDSQTLSLILSYYFSFTPLHTLPPKLSSAQLFSLLDNLLKDLEQEGILVPKLRVEKVFTLPERIIKQERVLIKAEGQGIKALSLEILDLTQKLVLKKENIFGNAFEWNLKDNSGRLVENGFYTIYLKVKGFREEEFNAKPMQIVIKR